MKCTKCGNVNQPDALFCDRCGARLTAAATAAPVSAAPAVAATVTPPGLCAQCGAANTPGELFCGECGAPLDAPAPETAAVEPAPSLAVPAMPDVAVETATAADDAAAPMACPRCGAAAEPDDAFCAKCGAALAAAPDAPAPQEPAPAQPMPAAPTIAAQPAEASVESAAPLTECPSCGADVAPGDAFCDFCGAALVGAAVAAPAAAVVAPAPAAPQPAVAATPAGAVPTMPRLGGPQLIVVASGVALPLPESGEALIGREDPLSNTFPEVDLTPHGGEEGGVSRRHCKITLGDDQYAIQDLNSTNSTWLNRTRLQPGLPVALHDGDEIRAGRVRLQFRAG